MVRPHPAVALTRGGAPSGGESTVAGVFPPGLGPAPGAGRFLAALAPGSYDRADSRDLREPESRELGPRGPGGPPAAERVLVPSPRAGGRRVVLDAGFGDGRLRSQILAGGLSWVGADIDPARVAAARAAGFPAVCCDLTRSLPFRTGSVDGVVLVFVLNVIPRRSRRSRLAAEIRRVLKPGGVVWIRDFQRVDDPGDGRIGGEVGQAEWSAANRRHRWGRRLAAELAGVPARDLLPGSFPAFRVAPGFAGTDRFVNHRYSVRQFRRAVARRQVTFDFVACHSTADELRNEWGRIGVVEEVVRTVGQARGGTKLPALDLLVRM